MHELFYRLFCYKDFLPWLGDAQDRTEEADSRPIQLIHSNFDESMAACVLDHYTQFYRKILDPVRLKACDFLIGMTTGAIMAHEMRHILGGHLDFLSDLYSFAQLQEVHRFAGDERAGLIRQFLEKDADEKALTFVHANLDFAYKRIHPDMEHYQYIVAHMNTYDKVVELSVVCFEVMYKLFSMNSTLADADWAISDHPPDSVRRSMLLDSFKYILTSGQFNGRKLSHQQVYIVFHDVEIYVDSIFRRMFPDRAINFKPQSRNKIHAHKGKIRKISDDLWRGIAQGDCAMMGNLGR